MSNRDKSGTEKTKGKKVGMNLSKIMEKGVKKKFDDVKKETNK